jgi:beta-lactamase class C
MNLLPDARTRRAVPLLLTAALLALGAALTPTYAADTLRTDIDTAVRPVMAHYAIPGMAVAITDAGHHEVFTYGLADTAARRPVTDHTLFEIGSVSKTFTATLTAWAEVDGQLTLSARTSAYLPALQGSRFGGVTLQELGTHTPGGLPLQLPETITTQDELIAWLRRWQPKYPPGTYRTYNNIGIGLLGVITAGRMHQDFATLMEGRLFPALGLASTFITVPAARDPDYARGYTRTGTPIRMAPALLSAEAYGIRTTAPDMIRFVKANLGLLTLPPDLQRAVAATHTGYVRAGGMTQDLIWEQYSEPVALRTLLDGNADRMVLDAMRVTPITPPSAPRADVWINKTGSTNGFGAYVLFVPDRKIGVVILANRNYPNAARVRLAYQIVSRIIGTGASGKP